MATRKKRSTKSTAKKRKAVKVQASSMSCCGASMKRTETRHGSGCGCC